MNFRTLLVSLLIFFLAFSPAHAAHLLKIGQIVPLAKTHTESFPIGHSDPSGLETLPLNYPGGAAAYYQPMAHPDHAALNVQKAASIGRLRANGFNELADVIEATNTNTMGPYISPGSLGFTNPFTGGTNVKSGLSDMLFLVTAVHESYHSKQGRVRLLTEGVRAKLFGNAQAEYKQEYEAYAGEASFIESFMSKAVLTNDERKVLRERLDGVKAILKNLETCAVRP